MTHDYYFLVIDDDHLIWLDIKNPATTSKVKQLQSYREKGYTEPILVVQGSSFPDTTGDDSEPDEKDLVKLPLFTAEELEALRYLAMHQKSITHPDIKNGKNEKELYGRIITKLGFARKVKGNEEPGTSAYKPFETRSWSSFTAKDKAQMIMILDEYPESMETVTRIKHSITVPGKIVLYSHEAMLLARLISHKAPHLSNRLIDYLELKTVHWPVLQKRWDELIERLS